MTGKLSFQHAASRHIEKGLCTRLQEIRLSKNVTQQQLATEAGVSLRTITRLESGDGVTLDVFIRVISALNLEKSLETLLPDPSIRPLERVQHGGRQRLRARPKPAGEATTWAWDTTSAEE